LTSTEHPLVPHLELVVTKTIVKNAFCFFLCKKENVAELITYTVLHIFAQVLLWAEKQGNHQDFDPFILPYTDRKFFLKFDIWATKFLDLPLCGHSIASSEYCGQNHWLITSNMLLHGRNAVLVMSTSPQNFYQCIHKFNWFSWGWSKKNPPIHNMYLFKKISWIGPLVSRINWCKGHLCAGWTNIFLLHPHENQSKFLK
jgi:hypothetical protein